MTHFFLFRSSSSSNIKSEHKRPSESYHCCLNCFFKQQIRCSSNRKMAQKNSTSAARPYGTDGSDFSYRMVVDPRYTKVAEGKSLLKKLIITQAAIQLVGVICAFMLSSKKEGIDRFAMYSIIAGFNSLLIGEIGRKQSKAKFLRLYTIGTFAARLLSVVWIVRRNIAVEVFLNSSGWATKKFEVVEASRVLLGVPLEFLAAATTKSLIHNMFPPKRT